MTIIKRDGTPQEYNFIKIVDAVTKAFQSVDQVVPDKFLEQVKESVEKVIIKNNGNGTFVDEIHDTIQKELIKRNKFEVVESFINYRRKREEVREQNSDLIKDVQCALFGKNIQNQNANLDEESYGGRVGEAASVVCKDQALKMMSKTSRRNHEKNMVYIHDLDAWADGRHNCLTMPLDELLAHGFKTRQTDVRPAGSVNTAMQLVAVLFQLQSLQQFGGVSSSHLDWTMVPYVRKSFRKHYIVDWIQHLDDFYNLDILGMDYEAYKHWTENKVTEFYLETKLSNEDFTFDNKNLDIATRQRALDDTKRETYQAVEGMYHNLNTLQSRSGNQLPFTSINYGTCTIPEGRMVTRALLDVSMEGLGSKGVTSIFPCGIFQYMKGVNDKPGTPNYDLKRLALKSTAMRIYPNYCNVDWSVNAGYDRNDPNTYVSTMGCRTYNGADINAEPGVNPQRKDGRGNICPVTIIMPTLALMSRKKIEKKYQDLTVDFGKVNEEIFNEFMKLLDKKIGEAKDTLIERFNHIASQSPKSGKFMYENGTMSGYKPEEGIISALKHGTLALGQLGLAETLQIIFHFDHTSEKGMKYAKQIEQLFKTRCAEFKQQYKLNIGVYYTPAENLCKTAMANFKRLNPGFEQEYVTYLKDKDGNKIDKLYFTNSMHLPVWYNCDCFKKIDLESQLTGYSNAGCITYVELDSTCYNNIDAVEKIVDYAMEHDVPYFAINIPLNRCAKCGEPIYDEELKECPKCGCDEIIRLGRITGYLSTTIEHFNAGKKQEFEHRVDHIGQSILSDC
jgi:ribonucleoside-triphosphate reductase